jgi:hypothetical protein
MFADMGLVRRRGLALGAAIVATSAIAGCGGSKDDDDAPAAKPAAAATTTTEAPAPASAAIPAPGDDDAIVRAVDAVAAQKGGMAVTMRGTITGKGQKTTKVRGNGKIDRDQGRGSFTVTTEAGATDLSIREVLDDDQLYLTSKLFTNKLPGKRSWMRIDLGKLQDTKGFDQAALGTNGPSQDPSQVLDYLRGAGPAKRVGTAKIRGTQTTHYRADVDLKRALKAAEGKATAQRSIQSLIDVLGDKTTIPVEVWLDGDHRVLRERVSYKATLQGVESAMTFTTDFTKFGVPVSVDAPASSDTVDGLKLLTQNQQQPQG